MKYVLEYLNRRLSTIFISSRISQLAVGGVYGEELRLQQNVENLLNNWKTVSFLRDSLFLLLTAP
jgi:hypothetical protein